jgi:hypothetical protein
VHDNWWAITSSDDKTFDVGVLERLSSKLKADASTAAVQEAVSKAASEERERRIENLILKPYCLTLQAFYQDRLGLGEQLYQTLVTEMRRYTVVWSMIIAGFAPQSTCGSTIYADYRGACDLQCIPGYCAIGSGAKNARTMLDFHCTDYSKAFVQVLYDVVVAKKFADYASGVGPKTELLVLQPGLPAIPLPASAIQELEEIWKGQWLDASGQAKRPTDLGERIAGIMTPVLDGQRSGFAD